MQNALLKTARKERSKTCAVKVQRTYTNFVEQSQSESAQAHLHSIESYHAVCRYYCATAATKVLSPVDMFHAEAKAQLSLVRRVEKITVNCVAIPGKSQVKMLMNKHISTPFLCTKHLGEPYLSQSALALVNGEQWSMHKRLVEDCDIQLLNFQQDNPSLVNQAFWRTCTLILGAVLKRAFKPKCNVLLHRPLDFKVESGSFAYDFCAKFASDWSPSQEELSTLSQQATRLSYGLKLRSDHYYIQPLKVSHERAMPMFSDNRYKVEHLQELQTTQDDVTVYRIGTHLDMINKPLVSNANLFGRFNVTAIHKLREMDDGSSLYRAQGVALPKSITMHSWTYDLLLKNALALNESEEISEQSGDEEEPLTIAAGGSQ